MLHNPNAFLELAGNFADKTLSLSKKVCRVASKVGGEVVAGDVSMGIVGNVSYTVCLLLRESHRLIAS